MKKIIWHCCRGIWFFKLGLLLVIALALLTTRIAINELPEYRGQIQQLLSDRLGVPVSVGVLRGSWQGFNPAIVMDDLQIGPQQEAGQEALMLEDVLLELDSIASLRTLSPVFRSFRIDQLEIRVDENESGDGWHLSGFAPGKSDQPKNNDKNADEGGMKALAELFLDQPYVAINNVYLRLQPLNADSITVIGQDFQLLDEGASSHIQMMLQLSQGQPVNIMAEVDKSLESGKMFVETDNFRLDLLQSLLPKDKFSHLEIEPAALASRVWGRFDESNWSVQGDFRIPALEVKIEEQSPPALESLSAHFSVQANRESPELDYQFQAALENLTFIRQEKKIPSSSFYVSVINEDKRQFTLAADRVDLETVREIALDIPVFQGWGRDLLETLSPAGELEHVALRWVHDAAADVSDFDLSAQLNNVQVSAWNSAPSGSGVNGLLRMGPRYGYLDLDSDNFSLGLPELFRDTWHYQKAKGRLAWELSEGLYRLDVDELALKGSEGDLKVALQLDVPFGVLTNRPVSMKLAAGITDGDGRYTSKYLPVYSPGMSPALVKWLESSIKSAFISGGSYMMNGPLEDTGYGSIDNTIALFFDIENAELEYAPEWPELRELKATVVVDPDRVDVMAEQAKLYGSTLAGPVNVSVPDIDKSDTHQMLHVTGQLNTNGADALKLLRKSPIAEALDGAAEDWEIGGQFNVGLKLDIPLEEGGKETVRADIQAVDARFKETRENLDITAIDGSLFYDSDKGLGSGVLKGKLWEDPLTLTIATKRSPENVAYEFAFEHKTTAQALQSWMPMLKHPDYSGPLAYKGLLTLRSGKPTKLSVSSQLEGLAITLPAPFGKTPQEKRSLNLDVFAGASTGTLSGQYADAEGSQLLDLLLSYDNGRLKALSAGLGGEKPNALSPGFIRVQGNVSEVDESEWRKLYKRQHLASTKGDPAVNKFDMRLEVSQVVIDKLRFGESQADNVAISVLSQVDGLDIQVDSAQIRGSVLKPYNPTKPWQVAVDRLQLSDDAAEAELWSGDADEDPLGEIDPRLLPAMNIVGSDVRVGSLKIDRFGFNARPFDKGVHLMNLDLQRSEARLEGTLRWNHENGIHSSHFQGQLETKKIEALLKDFGYDEFMLADRTKMSGDIRWAGSPAYLNASRLEGTTKLDIRSGRFPEGSSTSALRVFGVLNVDSIMRRLRLDFSDLYRSGLSFDRIKGITRFDLGVISFPEPLEVTGPSSDFTLGGSMNLPEDKLDMELVVTLPVTENLPIVGLLLGQPQIAGAIYLFDKLLGKKVQQFASMRYKITGTLDKPEVGFDKAFSDKVKKG